MTEKDVTKQSKTTLKEAPTSGIKLVDSSTADVSKQLPATVESDVADQQSESGKAEASSSGSVVAQRARMLSKASHAKPPTGLTFMRWLMYGTSGKELPGKGDFTLAEAFSDKVKIIDSKAVFVRYRSFAGVDRWLRDRIADNKLQRYISETAVRRFAFLTMLSMFFMVLPFFLSLVGIFGLHVIIVLVGMLSVHAGTSFTTSMQMMRQNQQFFVALQMFLLGGLGGTVMIYRSMPTDLALTQEGIRWYWRRDGKCGNLIRWSELDSVMLSHNDKKGSEKDDEIIFSKGGKQLTKLKVNSLDTTQDKELLLAAIECWAPHLKRNAELVQALQPPADSNYTEVWLTALTAPPKRERLKPLVEGVKLHEDAYQVVRSIGTGGQGFAYLAEQADTREQVVLKEFILPVYVDVAVRRKALEKFETEARLLKRLEHNQIVKLVDYFVEDHRAYLVLEYIDGVSLHQLVQDKGPLPETQVLELTKQMGEILEYLHSSFPPIVHRDFTPDNLILRKDGTLKLIDFNVAQQVDSTVVATVVGKHAYLAPEQFQGVPCTQSDIYSMGATMHYLLTGSDPVPISVSAPQKLRPEIDDLLNLVVSKATTRPLNERYGTIRDLINDLFPLDAIPFRIDPEE